MVSKAIKIGIVLLALLYVIWPLDFIPDFIPVIGALDDIIAVIIGIMQVASIMRNKPGERAVKGRVIEGH